MMVMAVSSNNTTDHMDATSCGDLLEVFKTRESSPKSCWSNLIIPCIKGIPLPRVCGHNTAVSAPWFPG